MREGYHGGGGKQKRLTRKQIQEMVDNMRKSGIINKKSNAYHVGEEKKADDELKKQLDNINR